MKLDVSSIIFDLDGTLLDTIGGLTDTTNEVLEKFNFPQHTVDRYKQFVGNGMRTLIERAVPGETSSAVIDHCCMEFEKKYTKQWMSNCWPYDGINDMLAELQNQGIPLAILSNKPHRFTQLFVEHFFPEGMFRFVFGQREGFAKKPDPLVAVEIANMLQVDTQSTLFVGDSAVDIQTGKNGGMKTAAVSWGFRSVEELSANTPDILINHPLDLLEHVILTY